MPWREDEDASQVVLVPRQLFLGEEADDLLVAGEEVGMNVDKVVEGIDIEEDGLVVKEELRKEREILAEELPRRVVLVK